MVSKPEINAQRSHSSFESLPTEILDMIVCHLRGGLREIKNNKIGRYAAVCRIFQTVVERYSFRNICNLRSTELLRFHEIFSRTPHHHHRRTAVQHLDFEVILPTYSAHACAKLENARDKQANNTVFTASIQCLFGILRNWNEEAQAEGHAYVPHNIGFNLRASSPMDGGNRTDASLHGGKAPKHLHIRKDCRDYRYAHSYLELINLEICPLPTVTSIVSFRTEFVRRRLSGVSAVALATALPNLEDVDWTLSDNEWRYPLVRRQQRYDFAQRLNKLTLILPQLEAFCLSYVMKEPLDHHFRIPSALHPSSPGTDHLSRAIYALSQCPTIKVVYIGGIVLSADLFWPTDANEITDEQPFWPSLEEFAVIANPCAADGGWYFERKVNYSETADEHLYIIPSSASSDASDNEDEWLTTDSELDADFEPDPPDEGRELRLSGRARLNQFRRRLSPATFNPILFGFAKAVQRMPKLKLFRFDIKSRSSIPISFQAEWAKAGFIWSEWDTDPEKWEVDRNRWTLAVAKEAEWKLPASLMNILEAGVGAAGIVRFRTIDRYTTMYGL
ncbi:hypothetical protein BDZ91DRAFT_786455 [Kalaharituber pfeilii]|nr:hypothetical protein BDZ91DRAFT_786455 [Kalaharituber pfeilii]